MCIRRGDIYFIKSDGAFVTGSEIRAGRPAVIVSNDKNNRFSTVVEVVYLTLQRKNALPTHTMVQCAGKIGTALCEQVASVSTDRLLDVVGRCTPDELKRIDKAIMVSLGIEQHDLGTACSNDGRNSIVRAEERIGAIEKERDLYKHLYGSLMHKVLESIEGKRVNQEE